MLDLDVLTSWKPQNQAHWADLLDHEREQLIGLRTEMTRLPEAPRATVLPLVAARRYLHLGADIDTMITALGMIAQAKRVAAVRVGAAKDEALAANAVIVSHGWSVVCEAEPCAWWQRQSRSRRPMLRWRPRHASCGTPCSRRTAHDHRAHPHPATRASGPPKSRTVGPKPPAASAPKPLLLVTLTLVSRDRRTAYRSRGWSSRGR